MVAAGLLVLDTLKRRCVKFLTYRLLLPDGSLWPTAYSLILVA